MVKVKKAMTILLAIVIITFFYCLQYINNKIHLNKEQAMLLPIGTIVEIDGHNMSVYVGEERRGIFMACTEVHKEHIITRI